MILPTAELYSDVHCPWAYLSIYRLRRVWPEYQGRLRIVWRSLSLEIQNERPTPKRIVDNEVSVMLQQEPELPMRPWSAPVHEYPVTFLPAFEAIKCAELQGDDQAWALSWRIREAFFRDHLCVSMRHVLIRLAGEVGLDVAAFSSEWDLGRHRPAVLAESESGWRRVRVPGSPTFVLPSGRKVFNPAAAKVTWGPNHEPLEVNPPDCPGGDCLQVFRDLLDEATHAS
ncbi:MAG: DsbA family protein [Chloroflexi bacterium]|nr:DsbA family protein [Chloroflexota bacterium]